MFGNGPRPNVAVSASSREVRRCLVLAIVCQMLGCASPGQPAMQTIRVETPGCARATCELSNDLGTWLLPETPGKVTLTPSREPLKASCQAKDGVAGHSDLLSALPKPTGAGAVAGGAVAVLPSVRPSARRLWRSSPRWGSSPL